MINFKLLDEPTNDFLVAVRSKLASDNEPNKISIYRTSGAPGSRVEFTSGGSDYFSAVAFTPDNKFAAANEAATWRIYDLTAPFSSSSSRVFNLNIQTRFSKIFAGEKSVLIAALVYGDFTIWKLDVPPDASRASRYMNEIIRREERARRRQLEKDTAPRSATWREILLAAVILAAFGMIFNFCNR